MRLFVFVLWTITWALASAIKSDEGNNKKKIDPMKWVDASEDSTFDSLETCRKIIGKIFFRDLFSDQHRYDDRILILKLIISGVGYVGGVMPCIALLDTVIYPYNVVKQSASDVKLLKKKGGSKRSQLLAILKSIASPPFKTFDRVTNIIDLPSGGNRKI